MNDKFSATARVTLTVEMIADSTWGNDCKLDQIFRQAGEETKNKLIGILREHDGKVIGDPIITAILVPK